MGDRFGMYTEIDTIIDPKQRVKIVTERNAFELDPLKFRKAYEEKQSVIRKKILNAQKKVSEVRINKKEQLIISEICSELIVDGLRGDIVTTRAACAYAAYRDRSIVELEDVYIVISLCLKHRLRKDPLENNIQGKKGFPQGTL